MNFADDARTHPRIWIVTAIIFVLAASLRWATLGDIHEPIFDEAHYVPAAEVLVGLKEHPGMGLWASHPLIGKAPAPNFEHPLLGKFLIGLGLRAFPSQPYFGARFFSALIGCCGLVLFAWLARRFFKEPAYALLALFFLGGDSLHMLHSRLAMLDIFVVTAVTGLLLTSWRLVERPEDFILRLGASFWLAAGFSSKWVFAFAVLGFCFCVFFLGRGSWKLRVQTISVVGVMALALYHLWFLYYAAHGFSYAEWLEFHVAANAVTTGKLASHPYGASALSMLLNSRNIWYYFKQQSGFTFGLVGLLNPVLLFSLLPALVVIMLHYFKTRQREDLFILGWFACLYLPFYGVLLERQGFLYYMLMVLPIIILAVLRMIEILATRMGFRWLALGYSALFLAVAGFYAPVVLAWPMTQSYYLCLIRFTGI